MKRHAMAIGATLLVVLGGGCTTQPDVTAVSAMIRTDESRPDPSRSRVTVPLREIVTP